MLGSTHGDDALAKRLVAAVGHDDGVATALTWGPRDKGSAPKACHRLGYRSVRRLVPILEQVVVPLISRDQVLENGEAALVDGECLDRFSGEAQHALIIHRGRRTPSKFAVIGLKRVI